MRWKNAFVVKELENGDFSGLEAVCEKLVFLYGPEKNTSTSLPSMIEQMAESLRSFNCYTDILVLSGQSHQCAMAFGIIVGRDQDIDLAVFREGKYEFFRVIGLGAEFPGLWAEPIGERSA